TKIVNITHEAVQRAVADDVGNGNMKVPVSRQCRVPIVERGRHVRENPVQIDNVVRPDDTRRILGDRAFDQSTCTQKFKGALGLFGRCLVSRPVRGGDEDAGPHTYMNKAFDFQYNQGFSQSWTGNT